MKLLNKSTLYLILFLIPVFVISGFILFAIISNEITDNTDESLLAEKEIIIKNFLATDSIEQLFFNDAGDDVKILPLHKIDAVQNIFTDTMMIDSSEMELAPYRQLKSSFSKGNKPFEIILTRSNIESDDLIESISLCLLIMFGLILISVIFINRFISRKLFNPFYNTLEKLNSISFANIESPSFDDTTTREFQQLNKTVNRMTAKLFVDYNNQKQFTENASHELQTPLAIIKTRLDELIQDRNLSEESMEQIQEIEKSVNKLSHLNKSLLLLSKIENHQFAESKAIDLQALVDKLIIAFDDNIKAKNISLHKKYTASPVLQMNQLLAEILFSNLLQNAARHNAVNGSIEIKTTANYFSISNPGESLKDNEEKIFNRFAKFNPSVESLGLGLSIVKQICDYYNFQIDYSYCEELHSFIITFNL